MAVLGIAGSPIRAERISVPVIALHGRPAAVADREVADFATAGSAARWPGKSGRDV